ncbi:hypothetical protein IWZ00DRAFT_532358 [Phyllosticta capitalensis]
MQINLLILAFMAVTFFRSAYSLLEPRHFSCGNRFMTTYSKDRGGTDDEPRNYSPNFSKRQTYQSPEGVYEHQCPWAFLVPVYAHLFGDYLEEMQIRNAMAHLRNTFVNEGIPIVFVYMGAIKRDDEDMAEHLDHLGMVEKTRVGGFQTLNVYFVKTLRASHWKRNSDMRLHAMATMPHDAYRHPLSEELMKEDMIVLDYRVITGELMPKVGLNAIVHEVGHWLGLYHQYHGGCHPDRIGGGDYILDTPASAWPLYDCPSHAVITCPPPMDMPVDAFNFMDSTLDDCKVHFTPGQIEKMVRTFCAYRFGTEFEANPPIWDIPEDWSDFPNRFATDVYAQVHYAGMR